MLTIQHPGNRFWAAIFYINLNYNKCECTTDPAWRALSAIAEWQVDIRTHRPGSHKTRPEERTMGPDGAALKQAAELVCTLNLFNSLMDFIKHA